MAFALLQLASFVLFNFMKFLIGKKVNMTQIFTANGEVKPTTVVSAPLAVVTQIKTKEKDGYRAVQVGFGAKKEKNIKKPERGHAKGLGNFEGFKEFRVAPDDAPTLKVGDKVEMTTFKEGDSVAVSAISKGKGFQGVVKRHGFHGGSRTHGQKHSEREPGSIGGRGRAGGRVSKGMRMAGRMGGERVTVKGLKVLKIDSEGGLVYLSGAVPGRRGTLVEIIG